MTVTPFYFRFYICVANLLHDRENNKDFFFGRTVPLKLRFYSLKTIKYSTLMGVLHYTIQGKGGYGDRKKKIIKACNEIYSTG